ncbi:MAG: hypothetical protein EOO12_00290 [Chitinophagaceae bacterium]|nr:MAG: hypothetical protein EOO12_00290 [Chitinophagaceae bacterium]
MKRLKPDPAEVRYYVNMVTPETVLVAMGIPVKMRWEGRRSWYEWTDKEQHIVSLMHGPLSEIACGVAVRVVAPPEAKKMASYEIELVAYEYLHALVRARDKFVRRVWRKLQPFAC